MPNTTAMTGAPAAPMSLPARFIGIITAPKETFQSVAAHPRWFGMLLICTVLVAVCAALPMTTDAGKEATLRQQVEGMESFGMTVSDQAVRGHAPEHAVRPLLPPASPSWCSRRS